VVELNFNPKSVPPETASHAWEPPQAARAPSARRPWSKQPSTQDPRTERARRIPIEEEVVRYGVKLERQGAELVGPCPKCGGDDRFAVNAIKQVFNCRGCDVGGDVIDLVMHLNGVDFSTALDTLTGDRPAPSKPEGKRPAAKAQANVTPRWIYKNEDGSPYLGVVRIDKPDGKKSFAQYHWNGGGWATGKPDGPKIPYRLPEIVQSPGRPVFVCEGEKCADAVADLGLGWLATTASEGASKWTADLNKWFAGRSVYVLADNDEPGAKHAQLVASNLHGVAREVRIVELEGLSDGEDVFDWIKREQFPENLLRIAEEAPTWQPKQATAEQPSEEGDIGDNKPVGVTASPFVYRSPATIPRREFLFGRHAVRKFVSVTAAAGGTGKTANAMVEQVAFVIGRDLLNDHLRSSGGAWYIGLEDPLEEYERRLAAILLHYKIDPSEIEGGFFLDSGRDQDFVIARESRNGVVITEPVVDSIIREILANNITHVTIDPYVSCHGVNENDNAAMERVARQWAGIADATGAAIELVHHIRKLAPGEELTAEAARGAKALTDAARSVRLLVQMQKDEAEKLGVDERRRYFRVVNGKANLFLPPDEAVWRKLVTVPLGNGGADYPGDEIQVAATWSAPKATDGISSSQVAEVIARLGEGEYRADSQANAWAGHVVADVLGLDLERPAERAKVKSLLRTWIDSGALLTERRKDTKRQEREFIVPGPSIDLRSGSAPP